MHTAVAEITQVSGSRSADIVIRVFADDFGSVVRATPGLAGSDSAMSRYVRGTFAVTDPTGRPRALHWAGARQDGDVIVLHVTLPASEGLSGARVTSALLCERFHDQVNIVRATYGGKSATLLFTPGDASKVLP